MVVVGGLEGMLRSGCVMSFGEIEEDATVVVVVVVIKLCKRKCCL